MNTARRNSRNPTNPGPVHGWGWWDPQAGARAGLAPVAALAALAFGGCDAATGQAATGAARPNLVILVSDDQDYEHFSFAGHPTAKTPTIDSLAKGGVLFTHAFVPMSRCRPAQASLLTGEWPHQNGVYFNVAADHIDPDTCLANRLGDAGYRSFGEGKFWEYDPRLMGFENYSILNYETFARLGQEHLFEWLRGLDRDQPFFVWWAPMLPHVPHDPPDRFLERFDPADIEIPAWIAGDVEEYRHAEHLSLAMGSWLDDAIRELMDELREIGELDDTLFLFLIDNGYANGLPSKGTAFDKGLRTPAILSWAGGIEAGGEFDELISVVDLYATLLDYAGARALPSCEGESLRRMIEGSADDTTFRGREFLFGAAYPKRPNGERADPARDAYALWARTSRLKYILYLDDVTRSRDSKFKIQYNSAPYPARRRGDEDLFDLDQDPYELNDLSDDPALAAEMADLKRRALEWWRETGGGELSLP